jgi:hypothetical protein
VSGAADVLNALELTRIQTGRLGYGRAVSLAV